ncbi:M56 family metallopeptidase [Risungbinella massiliensis]|uniref:M56 family metallopeptidase n=1 Tax=Risungbinella massiliensis TaxID=1329796 RepID=UPI0005CC4714|nr:M56 family metallopeptidase [Risungbinella massiliensis]
MNRAYQTLRMVLLLISIVLYLPWIVSTDAALKHLVEWIHKCCGWIFVNHEIPTLYYPFSLFILLISGLIGYQATRIFRNTRKYIQLLMQYEVEMVDTIIQRFTKKYRIKVLLVDQAEPIVFTFGFRKPQILISTGMLQTVAEEELIAILEHERWHCKQGDPWKGFITSTFANSLFFFPIIGKLRDLYFLEKEILADQFAIQKSSKKVLVSALIKLASSSSHQTARAITPFVDGSLQDYRIDAIVSSDGKMPRMNGREWLLSGSALLVLLIIVFFLFQSLVPQHFMWIQWLPEHIRTICGW